MRGFQLTDAWFPPGLTLAPHEHERTVVAVTVQGQWDSVMQHRPYDSAASTVLIEPAGQRHANHFTSATRVLIIQPEAARCEGWAGGTHAPAGGTLSGRMAWPRSRGASNGSCGSRMPRRRSASRA